MSKISIVGVEGSGKTTLMAAFGEKYEVADEAGYFVTADNQQTFDKVKMLVARMRRGEWPSATEMGSVSDLGWTLWRRCKGENKLVSSLTFLDYGGEIYRLAFGTHTEAERKPFVTQIQALRHHIETSDAILLLINLKDVISGDLTFDKTREMLWVSRSIFDLARAGKRKPHLALAFSQTDLYRETLEATGGIEGAYRKYLPFIQSPYPDMRLLALAAVDRTTVDAEGREIPSPDFHSAGLDGLMSWLSSVARERTVRRKIRLFLVSALVTVALAALAGVGICMQKMRERDAPSWRSEPVQSSSISSRQTSRVKCEVCDGTGRRPARQKCTACRGRGAIVSTEVCSDCDGTGSVDCDFSGSATDLNPMHGAYFQKHMLKCVGCNGFGCLACSGLGFKNFCPKCVGSGKMLCRECNGQGKKSEETPCEACDGGYVSRNSSCQICDGKGWCER